MPTHRRGGIAMLSVLCIMTVAASISRATGAAADTAISAVGNELPPAHHQYQKVHRSHVFHVEPHAIISSILSDVSRQPLTQNDEGSSLLDIDLSSTRLDDDSLGSLMEGLLPLLESKADEAESSQNNEKKAPLLVKLAMAMNKITPSGASNMLEMLVGKDETKDADTTTKNGGAANEDMEGGESNTVVDDPMEGLSNETIVEDIESNAQLEEVEPEGQDASEDTTISVKEPSILVEEIDLSFNDMGGHGIHSPDVKLLNSVRRLFEGDRTAFVPRILTLENCGIGPAFCRSIGRGILNAYERKVNGANTLSHRPSVLRIGGNNAIGDAGTVALAAALRMSEASHCDDGHRILEELDLSSCHVGDAGAEALALAIASNPGCLSRLDLSNNKITDAGSKALGRALVDALHTSSTKFEQIILDNNSIGDDGAAALAEALACGAVKRISLRSCSVQAQGAAAFGKAIMSLANRKDCNDCSPFQIDLSGNHFGTRKIKKKKGAAYSAGLIRDRASTNIKFIGKTLKGAAKRFGSETMGITADSDDDEEVMGGLIDDEEEEVNDDKLRACGGHALAGEILRSDQKISSHKKEGSSSSLKISVGLRQCLLDDGAIDALSASVVGTNNCDLLMDVSMNSAEEEVVDALINAEKDSKLLKKMAERHMDLLDRIADARQRQLEAAETASSRVHDLGGTFDDEDDFYDEGFDYDPYDDFD